MRLPSLEHRSLEIDRESNRFYYQYEKCTRKWLKKKCKTVREHYDLSDKVLRNKLRDMGFVLTKREII